MMCETKSAMTRFARCTRIITGKIQYNGQLTIGHQLFTDQINKIAAHFLFWFESWDVDYVFHHHCLHS